MAIIEHAVNNNYTMSSTGEVLYLYTGEWMGTQGQMINSSNAVANDLDNKIYGTSFNGNFGSGNNVIHALAGNDTVFAYSGNDMVYGGDGNDVLDGGAGGIPW